MSGRWSEEQTTTFLNMYKDSESFWNVFTPEYKNREGRLASLKHMVREMNIPNFGVKDVSKKIKSLKYRPLIFERKLITFYSLLRRQ